MKKRIIFSVILILSIFMITGCNNNEHNYKLRITESSWSGWTSDYQPKEVTKEYDVVLGKEYNIDSGNFIFKINLAQWAHVYKMRNKNGSANPEVKEVAERIQDAVEKVLPWFDRG